ncbi:MAG: hypothetical protein AAFZ07_00020 [Actinomycetota bacterium]
MSLIASTTPTPRVAVETCVPAAVAAWLDGPARHSGPLTGYRLFDPVTARAVPEASRVDDPVIQIHVADGAAAGHGALLRALRRHGISARVRRLSGLGVAAHLVDDNGRRSWVGPVLGRRVVPAGAEGTTTPTVGLVLRFPDADELARAWRLLDEIDDELYDQQVLDRSAHVHRSDRPPAHAVPVGELHVRGDDGSRLVHLHPSSGRAATAWVPSRPGRFDLGDWIHDHGDRLTA